MPNDAKLGLVLGVGLVITVAVVFFHKEPVAARPGEGGTGTAINPPAADTAAPPAQPRPARPANAVSLNRPARRHTVQAGDTLFSVARRYYGDGDKFVELYRANRQALKAPDALPPGLVLTIPDVTADRSE